jgi:ribosomal-protein-alanine N-acetyltransferase
VGESSRTIAAAPGVSLRRATSADLEAISALEEATFTDPWSRNAFALALHAYDTVCTVAEDGCADRPALVGYSVLRRAADEAELLNLAVSRSHRRRRIGGTLLTRALDDARQLGARAVFLEVRTSNHVARALYAGAGFEQAGRRQQYYRRPVEDALILRYALP